MRYDVVVIGGGVVGLAAARAVARRGSSVLLLEQFALHHDRGSSHGSVRAGAFAHTDPVLVDPSVEARALLIGLRALTLLPFGIGAAPLPILLGLIVVFAAGILLSMSLFGVAFAGFMSARVVARLGRAAGGAMGIASILLGVFWIFSA